MTQPTRCLDPDTLEEFVRGKLAEEACKDAERHLQECDACYEVLKAKEPSDTLVEALRQSQASGSLSGEIDRALADRVTAEVTRLHPKAASGESGIMIACPECLKKLHVKAELAGKRVKCPACGASIDVEATNPNDAVTVQHVAKANDDPSIGAGTVGPTTLPSEPKRPANRWLVWAIVAILAVAIAAAAFSILPSMRQ